jgi:hypothetical protein
MTKCSGRKITVSETQKKPIFSIEKCRAKLHTDELIDCLTVEQAYLCSHALPFGYGFFCKHPQRMEFVKKQTRLDKVKAENTHE